MKPRNISKVLKPFSIFILLLFLISIIAIIWFYNFGVHADRETFNAKVWQENSDPYIGSMDPGCVRGGMALDLVSSGFLINLNLSQIIEILGPPANSSVTQINYELGQCSGDGFHNSVLAIYFSNGIANELKIHP